MIKADQETAVWREIQLQQNLQKEFRLLGHEDDTIRDVPEKVEQDAKIQRRHTRRAETARLFMTPTQRARLAERRLAKRRILFGESKCLKSEDNLFATTRGDDWNLTEFEFDGSDLESSDISSGDLSSEDDEDILAANDRDQARQAVRQAKIHLEKLRVDTLLENLNRIIKPRAARLTLPPGQSSAKLSQNRTKIKQINSSVSVIALGDTPIFNTDNNYAYFYVSTLQAGRPGFGLVTTAYSGGGLEDKCSCWLALSSARHAFVKYALGKQVGELPAIGQVFPGDCYGLCIQKEHDNAFSVDLFRNGDFICRVFTIAELYGFIPNQTSIPNQVYPAIATLDNRIDCAEYRFGLDALNDPLRNAHIQPKRYKLVYEDGTPHPRQDERRFKYAFVEVHTKGDGAPNAVWCQTFQARWTQSVECIHLIAIRKPSEISASDCDVSIRTRYIKAAHRATREVWLEGQLERDVHPKSCLWYVDDDGSLRFLLVKSSTALYKDRSGLEPADAQWPRLFDFDDLLEPDDMDYDRTDMDPIFSRRLALAQKKASEKASLELAKREKCEALGIPWTWVMDDGSSPPQLADPSMAMTTRVPSDQGPGGDIQPSYLIPGQSGYDVPVDTHLVLRETGKLSGV